MQKKKVGLVSWICGPNFGTTLQAFALQSAIEEIGCSVKMIEDYHTAWGIKLSLNHFTKLFGLDLIKDPELRHPSPKMVKVGKFKKEVFHYYRTLDHKGLGHALHTFDCFVCGSDQLWNTWNDFNPYYYLDFAEGKKTRVAYAVSMGPAKIKEEHKDKLRSLVASFDSVSLREKSGSEAIAALTGRKDINTVLDPTLLFDRSWWSNIAAESLSSEKYVAAYLLAKRDDYGEIVQTIKTRTGINRVLIIPSGENPELALEGAEVVSDAGPREFLSLLAGASYVLTDSFHGTAFALNFHSNPINLKRFADSDEFSQNNRLYELYEMLRIDGRFYSEDSTLWLEPIDFDSVDHILEKERIKSWDFLKKSIC